MCRTLITMDNIPQVAAHCERARCQERVDLDQCGNWDTWEAFTARYGPKEGKWGFSNYKKRLNQRLAKYGFTRSFQLQSDLSRQDALTTWIEYLGYEYWFYDQDAGYVRCFQRRHDEAWKKLVDSGMLRPGETYEVVCDIERVFRDASEEERAEKSLQSATTAVLAAEAAVARARGVQVSQTAHRRGLLAAQAALNTVQMAFESLKRRSDVITDFVQQTKGYRNAERNIEHQKLLLQWIQQQIPLIELESKLSERDSTGTSCMANGERFEVTKSSDVHEKHDSERQRSDSGGSRLSLSLQKHAESVSQGCGKRKRSSREFLDDSQSFKRRKDSSHSMPAGSSTSDTSDASEADLRPPESTSLPVMQYRNGVKAR